MQSEGGRVKECLAKEHVECKGGNGEEGREVWSPEIEKRMYVKQCVRKRYQEKVQLMR